MELAKENAIEIDFDALAQHYGIPTFKIKGKHQYHAAWRPTSPKPTL
jgi:hypothetical protein